MLERLSREIAHTIAGGLGARQRAAEGQSLAGDDAAVEAVDDALVLAEEVRDLASADTDVARRNVRELADVAVKLGHKALAEAHDFGVGLALGVKVGAALAAAHGERGQRVFEYLLKAEELDNGEVDRRMEAKPALVGTYGGVVLHAVAAVDLHLAAVVHPWDAELDDAFGLDEALDKPGLLPFGVLVDDQLQRLEDLAHGLKEFRLVPVAALHICVHSLQIFVCHSFPP